MPGSAPKHFDAVAGQYAASEVHANSPTIRRLHQLLPPKLTNAVSDIACGPGHMALSFAGNASRIVGVDAAPDMLREFERLARERNVKAETVQAYAESVPSPANNPLTSSFRVWPCTISGSRQSNSGNMRLAKPRWDRGGD